MKDFLLSFFRGSVLKTQRFTFQNVITYNTNPKDWIVAYLYKIASTDVHLQTLMSVYIVATTHPSLST